MSCEPQPLLKKPPAKLHWRLWLCRTCGAGGYASSLGDFLEAKLSVQEQAEAHVRKFHSHVVMTGPADGEVVLGEAPAVWRAL